jgi:FAD/FMN-containing dehydrogenase
VDDEILAELQRSVSGAVIAPADSGYDGLRRCFNALVDRRPAVIVRCFGASDVATAFDFALSMGLEVAVRGGGHNPAGHCVLDDGLVIDLSMMRSVDVDADAKIGLAEGGATWLDFDSATQAFGLVTPGGVVGSTGVAGLTFGGGIGHLTAQHGLTCDNLVGAEVVTPEGAVVRASEDEEAELLWGLRGGGGNFGVATRLEFRLHPLERVVGGRLVFIGDGVSEALRRFRDLVTAAPGDLSCSALLELDEELEPIVFIAPCYTGTDADPEELRSLRAVTGLVDDSVRPRSFLGQQHVFNPPYGEDRNYWKSHFVGELPDELVDELLARMVALGRPPGQVLIESLHGAPKNADGNHGAVGFRQAAFNISAMASWREPALDAESITWARETAAAVEPWSVSGGYLNYMQADEPIERVRAAFGDEAFGRLQALKRRYDPNNVLRRNQNIPPLDTT